MLRHRSPALPRWQHESEESPSARVPIATRIITYLQRTGLTRVEALRASTGAVVPELRRALDQLQSQERIVVAQRYHCVDVALVKDADGGGRRD